MTRQSSAGVVTPPDIAVWLVRHANTILRCYFNSDSCISSTAVAVRVMREYGIEAEAVPVQTKIFNPAAWRFFRHGIYGDSPEGRTAWEMAGAWSIGIGYLDGEIPEPGQYGGHLVAMLPEGWLLDLTLDQASRPAKGLELQPALIKVNLVTLALEQPITDAQGRVLIYSLNKSPWGQAYRSTPSWKQKAFNRQIADQILTAYREDIATKVSA